jgi:HK97 family phage major capsid protein
MPTRTPIPTTSAELEEMLGDTTRMAEVLRDPTEFRAFIRAYTDASMTKDLQAQIDEGIEAGIVDFQQRAAKTGGVLPAQRTPLDLRPSAAKSSAQRTASYWPDAPGAALDKHDLSLGDFARMSSHRFDSDPKINELRGRYRNDYGSVVPSEGGFLLPETLSSQLMQMSLETAVVRPRAVVVPMTTQTLAFPAVDVNTHVGSVFGGITTQWAAEGETLTPSSAKFGRILLQAAKLAAFAGVPNEFVADALPAFVEFITTAYPQAITHAEDSAFLTGDGIGKPLGVLKASSRATVAKETGQAKNTIVWENLVGMYARMFPSSLGRAVWIASIDTFRELFTMGMTVGTGGGPVMFGYGGGTASPTLSILGRPVIFTEKTPTIGNESDISFVDLGYYIIGDRKMLMAESSAHFSFDTDETVWRFIQRVDGRPSLISSITPKNAGSALSAYVTLADRLV